MKGTRLLSVLRESLGAVGRECRIALTPRPRPRQWVFLVGCYNSGTTLLASLLAKHPEISALPTEGHFITDQFVKDYEIGLPRMWAGREEIFRLTENDEGPDVDRIMKEWGMRLDLSKPLLLEKSPPNTPRTRWLQRNFAPAYFVSIVRNGYAVAEGIRRKADPKHLRDSWPIGQCAMQWRRSNEILLEDAPYLKHLLWVRYEDLVSDPLNELNRICGFLEIDPIREFDDTKAFSIHERRQSVRDLNGESIARLSDKDIEEINLVASDALRHFDYEVITKSSSLEASSENEAVAVGPRS